MSRRSLLATPVFVLALVLLWGGPAHGQGFQWPDETENLEVLPDDISSQELRQVMTSFTDALGVRCSHCHVGEEGADLSEYDFPADDKEPKQTARIMLRMVQDINSRHLGKLDHDVRPDRVTCVTCHRGAEEPYLIENVMASVIERSGVDSAVARYRQLRDRYYGGFTYDFRAGPLADLATRLAQEGNTDAALAMARLEVEYHPENYRAHFALAQVQDRAGMTAEARSSLQRAIELAPNDRTRQFLQRQLEALGGG